MSLTKDAIQHLEQSTLSSALNAELSEKGTQSNLLVVPEGFKISNIEQFMEYRDSYRASFSTKSISDFSEYCQEFDKDGAKCFVNSDNMNAKTCFDLGTEELPLHQLHDASLQLDKTAAFKSLLCINGDQLSQKEAANFIEDWSDNIKIYCREGESMTNQQAVKQFKEITIEQVNSLNSEVSDFGESMSAMEKIEAKNQDLIPATIEFQCNPYHGLVERAFTVRVSIITGGNKPEIGLRIIKLEAQEEDMAEEFKEILNDKFTDSKLKVFIGQG